MNRIAIATELVKLAKAMSSADALDINEVDREFDTRGLENEIRKRAGFDLKVSINLKPARYPSELWVDIKSDNLVDKIGLFSTVFNDVRITSGNNSIKKNDDGKLTAWIVVDIHWSHKSGGNNGADWFTAWYEFDKKKWTFRDR